MKSDGHTLTYGDVEPNGISGDRGVFAGKASPLTNTIDYIDITSLGDSTDFGDLIKNKGHVGGLSNSMGDRGVFSGYPNTMDYITITSTGDATAFGDMLAASQVPTEGCSNHVGDRGLFMGSSAANVIQYITISSTGDATDFGDIIGGGGAGAAFSNGTNNRGVHAGGYISGWGTTASNVICYVTITSLSNATDFGDILTNRYACCGTSNGVLDRGIYGGGHDPGGYKNSIEYVTITSLGNGTDFGDLSAANAWTACTSNSFKNRAVFTSGSPTVANVLEYVTITSLGDASDFGDLSETKYGASATSNA